MAEREWILLNPGPANTSPRVRHALQTPDFCHREPEFFEVMRQCRRRVVELLGIERTFGPSSSPVPAPQRWKRRSPLSCPGIARSS